MQPAPHPPRTWSKASSATKKTSLGFLHHIKISSSSSSSSSSYSSSSSSSSSSSLAIDLNRESIYAHSYASSTWSKKSNAFALHPKNQKNQKKKKKRRSTCAHRLYPYTFALMRYSIDSMCFSCSCWSCLSCLNCVFCITHLHDLIYMPHLCICINWSMR
jgi:hypothetical protein